MSDCKELISLRKQNENLREEIRKLKASNDSLRAEFNPIRDELADLKKMMPHITAALKASDMLLAAKVAECEKLKSHIQELEKEKKEAQTDVDKK